jgi:hypothetical protein
LASKLLKEEGGEAPAKITEHPSRPASQEQRASVESPAQRR